MQQLNLSPTDRVLVLAPHPDDETLACGGLIQAAIAAGAGVRVLFATDGDDNPWPQRWVERRLRIGPADRARWGARRRAEAIAALAVLGVRDASAYRFLGWPDQGLTDALMHGDEAVAAIATEIDAFAPTHIAAPALRDRHPDHSALRVMLELALLRDSRTCAVLGYVVHRLHDETRAGVCIGDDASSAVKQRAMRAHASQLALSARRLLTIAAAPECFDVGQGGWAPVADDVVRIALRSGWPLKHPHDLVLLVGDGARVMRLRARVPRSPSEGRAFDLTCADATALRVERRGNELVVGYPPGVRSPRVVFAKLHRLPPRLVVFDREPWHAAAGPGASADNAVHPATSG